MSVYNKGDQFDRQTQFGDSTEVPVGEQPIETNEPVAEEQGQHKEVQRKDRAKKRIQQLSTQKNAAEQEAAKYKAMYEETLTKMQNETKTSTANLKTTLEQQYNVVLQQMGDAIRSGEAEKVVQCQDAMVNIKIQLDKMNSAPVPSESPRVEAKDPTPKPMPELAKLWVEDHPTFHTDELFRNSAFTVNNQLLREGYDPDTEEFYEALSLRLSKRFPEVFGTQEESMVQYKGDDSTDDEPVAKTPVHRQVRTQEQTVSGPSRPSANTIRSSKSPNSQVNFEKNDSDLLNAWGLDPVKVAKRIKHNEASRQTDGYVPIFIPRNQ